MTIVVANTSNTNTFDYWKNRTNELAHAMTNYVVTTDSNTAVGNAAISNTFTANTVVANTFDANTSVNVGNSTVNVAITSPNSAQISSGTYYLNANGSWLENTSAPVTNGSITTTGTSAQVVDSFAVADQNAAEYYVHIKDNNANNYHASKILVVHSVGAAYSTEYATIVSNNTMGVFAADINSGNVRLLLTPTSSNTDVSFTRVNF
jgi:hypothetical protein